MLTLFEELFLLSLHEKKDSVKLPAGVELPYALAGALLFELVQAGKVRLDGKKALVANATPGENPLANDLLEKMAASKKTRKLDHWIGWMGGKERKLTDGAFESLVNRGVLQTQEKRFLWVIPYTGYSQADISAKFALKQHLRAVAYGGEAVDVRSAALLSLVRAGRMLDHLFTRDEDRLAKKRFEALLSQDAIGEAVVEAIEAVEGAVAGAVIVAMG